MSKSESSILSVVPMAITNTQPIITTLNVEKVFKANYKGANLSPIDQFITNSNKLNLIHAGHFEISPEFASILLLGYMSAVESYMRAVIRGLINFDPTCKKSVDSHQISFAAAISHKKNILPEALLEEVSFASSENIKKSVAKYLGVLPACFSNMDKHFDEFEKLCQLRHCSTHRFGRLGAKNWLALGLSGKDKLLEKPLELNKKYIDEAALLLRSFVKGINNALFDAVLSRSVNGGKTANQHAVVKINWHWDFPKDKTIFEAYYNNFFTKEDQMPSDGIELIYNRFMLNYKKVKA